MDYEKRENRGEKIYDDVKKQGFFKSFYAFLRRPFESMWKAVNYDSLSQQHTDNINKLIPACSKIEDLEREKRKQNYEISKQREKISQQDTEIKNQNNELSQQYSHINRLIKRKEDLFDRVCRLVNENESLEEELKFFLDGIDRKVEESPGYQNLGKERDEYRKQVEERGKLIDYLKNDKKNLIKFSHQIIDKIPATIIDYLKKDKYYSKLPLVFVNSAGVIVGYTSTLKEKLKIEEELIGQNCYKLLAKRYSDLSGLSVIRNFFNTLEEKSFDVDIKDKGREIKLHLLKEKPVFLKDLDLRVLGREKIIDIIAFIPIQVKPISKFMGIFHHDGSLDELIKKHGEEQKDTYLGLITHHGWTQTMITTKENDIGYQALREEFLELEQQLKENQKKAKNK